MISCGQFAETLWHVMSFKMWGFQRHLALLQGGYPKIAKSGLGDQLENSCMSNSGSNILWWSGSPGWLFWTRMPDLSEALKKASCVCRKPPKAYQNREWFFLMICQTFRKTHHRSSKTYRSLQQPSHPRSSRLRPLLWIQGQTIYRMAQHGPAWPRQLGWMRQEMGYGRPKKMTCSHGKWWFTMGFWGIEVPDKTMINPYVFGIFHVLPARCYGFFWLFGRWQKSGFTFCWDDPSSW